MMVKYVVVEVNGGLRLHEADKSSYIPAGWHKPHRYYTLDNLRDGKVAPAELRKACVSLPGLNTRCNNVRVMSDIISIEIDAIDAEILKLRKQRQHLIYDNFRTFNIVTESDIKLDEHTTVFSTKREAEGK